MSRILSEEISNYYEKIYLLPGDLFLSKNPVNFWTLLGSCISVIFHIPKSKISILCHAQLPGKTGYSCKDFCPRPCKKREIDGEFKYVDCSINFMIEKLSNLKIEKKDITASLFGGANVIKVVDPVFKIGDKNVEMARMMLSNLKIPIRNEDVGGNLGRTIYHYSDIGDTYVRKHKKTDFVEPS